MKKEKRKIKKKLSEEARSSLFTLIVILVILGITLPIHFVFPNILTTYWVIVICVAVITPFALVNSKIFIESKGNYTEEQKKAASAKVGMTILSIWYADFTFVCMFMDWLVAFFILAGLYLIKMVYDVASIFIKRKDSSTYPNFLLIGDAVLSFLLLIFLIYKIPNQNIQTIVTALSASLIGGLLTLLGVMLTINKSDNDRKEERRNQIKPFFYYTPYFAGPEFQNNKKTNHDKHFQIGIKHNHTIALGRFVNSDKTEFLLKSITFCDKEIKCNFDPAVSKGELFEIYLLTEEIVETPNEYILKIEDVDKNLILIKITLDLTKEETVPTNIEFLNEEVK